MFSRFGSLFHPSVVANVVGGTDLCSDYHHLGGERWRVELGVAPEGPPEQAEGHTSSGWCRMDGGKRVLGIIS